MTTQKRVFQISSNSLFLSLFIPTTHFQLSHIWENRVAKEILRDKGGIRVVFGGFPAEGRVLASRWREISPPCPAFLRWVFITLRARRFYHLDMIKSPKSVKISTLIKDFLKFIL